MKIILIGEYNRTHRNIKKGLESLGHQATVIAITDGFKKVDVDIEIKDYYTSFLLKKLRVFLFKFLNIDLLGLSVKHQIKSKKEHLYNSDIVQYINEAPFFIDTKNHLKIFKWIASLNRGKTFLLSCGLDYPSVSFAKNKKFRYSILTPYFEGKIDKKDHSLGFSYLTREHLKLHNYIYNSIKGVISNDLDYYIPLQNHIKHLGMIPHAIDLGELVYQKPIIEKKIIIFHGINTYNYYKKGNDIFEKALNIIKKHYSDKIEIVTTKNLPYKEYIKRFDKAHILLDQVYAYDQGYNALEAMAKGKVVFTGAEKEWLEYYNLKENTIVINAVPNAESIAKKIEWLILNPNNIIEISKNARKFVEQHHNHIKCAKAYLKKWTKD